MSTADMTERVDNLEKAQEVQAAVHAAEQATQAATFGGTWSTMIVGSVALVVGMFMGMTIERH